MKHDQNLLIELCMHHLPINLQSQLLVWLSENHI